MKIKNLSEKKVKKGKLEGIMIELLGKTGTGHPGKMETELLEKTDLEEMIDQELKVETNEEIEEKEMKPLEVI